MFGFLRVKRNGSMSGPAEAMTPPTEALPGLKEVRQIDKEWVQSLEQAIEQVDIRGLDKVMDIRRDTVSELLDDGIITLSSEGCILSANPKACELLGVCAMVGTNRETLPVNIPFVSDSFTVELRDKYVQINVKENRDGTYAALLKDITAQEVLQDHLQQVRVQRDILTEIGLLANAALTASSVSVPNFVTEYLSKAGVACATLACGWLVLVEDSLSLQSSWVIDGSISLTSEVSCRDIQVAQAVAALSRGEVIRAGGGSGVLAFQGASLLVPILVKDTLHSVIAYVKPSGSDWDENLIEILKIGSCTLASVIFRHDLEVRLNEAEKFLENLSESLNQLSDVILISNNSGKIVFVNRAFEKSYGYRLEDIRGMDYEKFLATESLSVYKQSVKGVVKQGLSWHGALSSLSKNGEKIRGMISITPLVSVFDAVNEPTYYMTTVKGSV